MSMLMIIVIPMFLRLAFVLLIATGLYIWARRLENNTFKSPMESMLFSIYLLFSIGVIAWSTVGLVTDINSSLVTVRQQEKLTQKQVGADVQRGHEHGHHNTNQQDVIKVYEHE